MTELRVSLVGCGAVALAHLPTVLASPRARATVLVDKDLARARSLAEKFSVPEAVDDYRAIEGRADAAILALPHHLHAPVAVDLLERGVHVLVEKPMALGSEECDRMIAASRASGAVLAVGMVSRFFAGAPFVKRVLDQGLLGPIRSFRVSEGFVYSWPVASDFMFRKEAGGGVLADTGAHTLDQLLWWLGDMDLIAYRDDAQGGVEADCELELALPGGGRGTVELSRTRDLGNRWHIVGEHGELRTERKFDAKVELTLKGSAYTLAGAFRDASGAKEDPVACLRAPARRLLRRDRRGAPARHRRARRTTRGRADRALQGAPPTALVPLADRLDGARASARGARARRRRLRAAFSRSHAPRPAARRMRGTESTSAHDHPRRPRGTGRQYGWKTRAPFLCSRLSTIVGTQISRGRARSGLKSR